MPSLSLALSLAQPSRPTQGGGGGGLNPADVFSIDTWTGTAVARNIATGIDQTTSMVWIKARSTTAQGVIFDTVRGPNFYWSPTSTAGNAALADSLTAFNTTNIALGAQGNVNGSGVNFVGWSFKRVARFFDVQGYTGNGAVREIAHNLGVEPGMIIVKRRDSAGSGAIYHRKSGVNPGAQYTLINGTAVPTVNNDTFGGVSATSSVFTLGINTTVNASGGTYVVYLFAHDPAAGGIIQCDSYTGNGLAAGPVVTLGWQPQFLYIRRIDGTGNHVMLDASRSSGDAQLAMNLTDAETAGDFVDFTPTGFQIKATTASYNTAASVYTYMAIKA